MAMLGRHLAHAYAGVVQSPLPPDLSALVERLDSHDLSEVSRG